jgi:hypothetical protein
MEDVLAAAPGVERRQMLICEQLRAATQIVRNWGYFGHVFEIMRSWAKPLDPISSRAIGFSFTQLIEVVEAVMAHQTSSRQRYFLKLRRVGESRSKKTLAARYAKEFLNPTSGRKEMCSLLENHPDLSRQSLWYLLATHSTQFLDEVFRFSEQDIARKLKRKGQRFSPHVVLESLSITPGSLKENAFEHFFLDNPIWSRPLMAMGTTLYSGPLSQVLLHGIWDTIRLLAAKDKELETAVHRRRASYLENAITDLCRTGFPGAQIATNSQYGTAFEYENDVLVVIGEFALIIEAKSGAPRASGLRGGMDSFRSSVKDLIVEPLIQSQRFAAWIDNRREQLRFPRRDGGVNDVDLSAVQYVMRLCVILEDLASMHAVCSQLQQADLIPSDVRLAPILTLADFRVLFDLLPAAAEKLHYLWRRQQLESSIGLLADELDLLGFYLQTGFNVGHLEEGPARLVLTGMSASVDGYYERLRIGFHPRKLRLLRSLWWNAMLERLAAHQPPRWLELSVKLLHVSPGDQRRIQRRFRRLAAKVRNNPPFGSIDSNAEIFLSGPSQRHDAFVFLAYREGELGSRNAWMNNAGAQAIARFQVQSVVVIAICVDRKDWPYSALLVATVDPEVPILSDSGPR